MKMIKIMTVVVLMTSVFVDNAKPMDRVLGGVLAGERVPLPLIRIGTQAMQQNLSVDQVQDLVRGALPQLAQFENVTLNNNNLFIAEKVNSTTTALLSAIAVIGLIVTAVSVYNKAIAIKPLSFDAQQKDYSIPGEDTASSVLQKYWKEIVLGVGSTALLGWQMKKYFWPHQDKIVALTQNGLELESGNTFSLADLDFESLFNALPAQTARNFADAADHQNYLLSVLNAALTSLDFTVFPDNKLMLQ